MQTNSKFSVRNTVQNGQPHEKLKRPPRRLAYTWHCSKNCKRLQAFSNVVIMNTACVLSIYGQYTVSSVVFHAETYHKPNPYPLGPCALYLQNVLSAVSPTLHAVFAKHAKTANDRAENGSGLSEKKNRPHTLKCS